MNKIEINKINFYQKQCEIFQRERQELNDLQEKRLTSFSNIIAFCIPFFGYLLQNIDRLKEYPAIIPLFLMIVGAVSILIGIITFIRVTYRQKQVVNLTEKIEIVQNKIMEENKVVKIFEEDEAKNLYQNKSDLKITKDWKISISTIVALLNSLLITIYISSILRMIVFPDIGKSTNIEVINQDRNLIWSIAILVFLLCFCIHYSRIKKSISVI